MYQGALGTVLCFAIYNLPNDSVRGKSITLSQSVDVNICQPMAHWSMMNLILGEAHVMLWTFIHSARFLFYCVQKLYSSYQLKYAIIENFYQTAQRDD